MKQIMQQIKTILFPLSFVAVFYLVTGVFKQPRTTAYIAMLVILVVFAIIYRADLLTFLGNLAHKKNPRKALIYYDMAVKQGAKSTRTYVNYAIVSLHLGEAKKALELLEKASQFTKDIGEEKNVYMALATAHWLNEDHSNAILVIEEMQEKYDYINPENLSTLAYLYYREGDYIKAEEMNVAALAEKEDLPLVWETRGLISMKQGAFEEAKESFLQALSMDHRSVDSLYFLSKLFEDEHVEKAYEYILLGRQMKINSLHSVTKEEMEAQFVHLQAKRTQVMATKQLESDWDNELGEENFDNTLDNRDLDADETPAPSEPIEKLVKIDSTHEPEIAIENTSIKDNIMQ